MSQGTPTLKNFLIISRAKIQIASLPTASLGIALEAKNWNDVLNVPSFLFILLFFIILTFACNLNCLCDVSVDRKFKKYMSDAVQALSSLRIKLLLTIEVIAALAIIILLCFLKKSAVYSLAVLGIICSYLYSAPPVRIKKRGFLSPLPVMLGLYFFPVVAGGFLIANRLTVFIFLFGFSYALIMQGITFLNTCEDYAEDKALEIQTLAHKLGISKTLQLGAIFVSLGGVLALILIGLVKFKPQNLNIYILVIVSVLALSFLIAIFLISRMLFLLSRKNDPYSLCKIHGRKMRLWFLTTRYPLLAIASLLLA